MQPDDLDARLRRQLRAELDAIPVETDGAAMRERLAERPSGPAGWRDRLRPLGVGALGALVVLAAVATSAVLLRGLSSLPPSSGGKVKGPPPHVLLVRELPPAANSSGDSSPLLEGRLVDPVTLTPVPGLPAVGLGHFYQAALSHDGQKLAIIRWPTDTQYAAQLVVLNLATGAQTSTGVVIDGDTPVLAFSNDDTTLTWVAGDRSATSANYRMTRYALGGKPQGPFDLPTGYWPIDGRLLPNGELALAVGTVSASQNGSGTPRLVFIGSDGSVRADLPLPGVLAGAYPRKDGIANIDNPGLAWDLKNDRLYVAHPGADMVTVVDLAARRIVARVDASSQASGWLGAFGVGHAVAKLEPGNDRSAALSPDGSRLYVVGSLRTVTGNGPGATFSQVPVGGFILDTRTMTRVATIGLAADRVAVASSGQTVLFGATTVDPTTEAGSEVATHSELILTDASLHIITRKTVAPHAWVIGLAPDGEHAYVQLGGTVASMSLDRLAQVALGDGYWVGPSLK